MIGGPIYGPSILSASLILTIMVMPFIMSVAREVLLAVPSGQREAAMALGVTPQDFDRWVKPEEFVELKAEADEIGFAGALSGPLVRSSYRAGRLYGQAMDARAAITEAHGSGRLPILTGGTGLYIRGSMVAMFVSEVATEPWSIRIYSGAGERISGDNLLADVAWGGNGNDTIHGNAGHDEIHGDGGNDKLYGDAGNDWLDGGTGDDGCGREGHRTEAHGACINDRLGQRHRQPRPAVRAGDADPDASAPRSPDPSSPPRARRPA